MEGQTLKLWCEVSGIKDPPASRTLTAWKKLPEGRIITDKFPRYKMRLGKYLRIRNVKPEDRGTYVCLASNLHGEITQEIRLVVLGKLQKEKMCFFNSENGKASCNLLELAVTPCMGPSDILQ